MVRSPRMIAAFGAAALLVPSAALAKSKAHEAPAKPATSLSQQAPGKPAVSWVFKGTWHIDATA